MTHLTLTSTAQIVTDLIALITAVGASWAYMARLHRSTRQKIEEAIGHIVDNGVNSVIGPIQADLAKTSAIVAELRADSLPNGGSSAADIRTKTLKAQEEMGVKIDGIANSIVSIDARHAALAKEVKALKTEVKDGHRSRIWPEKERERTRRTVDAKPKAKPVVSKPRPSRAKVK